MPSGSLKNSRDLSGRSKTKPEGTKNAKNAEQLSAIVVDAAFHLHKDLGPGLLESVYEAVLCRKLQERGLRVERQSGALRRCMACVGSIL